MQRFENRSEAGRELAQHLASYAHRDDVVVLALPRGGVPVAFEVAMALEAPLDVFLVRKLGVPGHEELAMGAIATGGVRVQNQNVLDGLGISAEAIERVAQKEARELSRRETVYRGTRKPPPLHGKTCILIDDGLATGASMLAAVRAVRQLRPGEVIVAVPAAPPDTLAAIEEEADAAIAVLQPEAFGGVGRWYRDFAQTSDEEVQTLLEEAYEKLPAA